MRLYILLAALVAVALADGHHSSKSSSEESHEDPFEGMMMRGEPMGHMGDEHMGSREHMMGMMSGEEKPLVRCKRPMCRMFCEHGFHLDENGCPECKCQEKPCENHECEEGETCLAHPDCESMPCTKLKTECVRTEPCAMPMCSTQCENGYKTDKYGCMSCQCKETVCEGHLCPSHHKCLEIHTPFCPPGKRCGSMPMCIPEGHEDNFHPHGGQEPLPHDGILEGEGFHIPQPVGEIFGKLCLFRQKFAEQLYEQTKVQLANSSLLNRFLGNRALHRPHCDEEGDFHPMQCHFPDRQCWCVNDLGAPLPDTTKDIKKKEDLPECIPHRTMKIEGTFQLNHELEEAESHLEHIKEVVQSHLSKWLRMDSEFIIITKIESKNTKENVIIIAFTINHDGKTDLTEIERKLLWHMEQTHSSIPYMETLLQPQQRSLKITHHAVPMMPEHGLYSHSRKENCFQRFYRHHRTAVIAGSIVVGAILFMIVFGVGLVMVKRRKMSVQFQHKRLSEKSEKYKQNLAYANEVYTKTGEKPGVEA